MNYKCEYCNVMYFDEDLTTEKIKLEEGNIDFCSIECAKNWIKANIPADLIRKSLACM